MTFLASRLNSRTLCFSLLATRALSFSSSNFIMSSVTERDGMGTITVAPKNEADQSALVVICHGLGDSAEGFVDVAENLARAMPHVKFVLPTAPTQPVTLNMGMSMPSWYDIVGLDERSNENCRGIEDSRQKIGAILENEHTANNLAYNRMVLAGFSQGGALALYTGLQLPQQLAAIVAMSGYVPASSQLQVTQPETPVLHCHGTQDAVVAYAMADKSFAHLKEKGVTNCELKSYPIGHTVSPDEIKDVLGFLMTHLKDDESCKITLKDPTEMTVKELKAAIRKAGLLQKAAGFMEKQEFVRLLQDHRSGKL